VFWTVGAVLLLALLVRFGMSWLAVVGGVLLAGARTLLPLLRFLPLVQAARQHYRSDASGSARSGAPPHPGQADPDSAARDRRQRMSRDEALQILGLDGTATSDDVRREYRRLMKKLHPDLGGSSYLAAKINEARDVLL
jgi:hypothetical protein